MAMLGFGHHAQDGIGRKYGGLSLLNTPAALLATTIIYQVRSLHLPALL